MNINFGLDNDGLLMIVLPLQTKTENEVYVISLSDYYQYKNELESGIVNEKIKINILSKECILSFLSYKNIIADKNQFSFLKTALDLVNGFLDKGESRIDHDFPNKNRLYLSLTTGSYFINHETVPVRHIELSMGEYCQGDYGGTTSEGCHYMVYDGVFMKPTDSLNAAKLFEISKFAGPTVSFKILNELFFNNELKFYSIEELANM